MQDEQKTKRQLIEELNELRRKTAHLSKPTTTNNEGEEKYKTLFDSIHEGIITTGPNGKILSANPAAAAIFGFESNEEMIGLPMAKFYADQSKRDELISLLKKNGYVEHFDAEYIRRDGSRGHAVGSFKIHLDKNDQTIRIDGIFRDITERMRAEQAVRESEEKYRNVVERATDGIAIIQDGLIKYINHRMEKMTGYQIDDLKDKPFTDFVDPEDVSFLVRRYKRRMFGERLSQFFEIAIQNKDGARVTVEASGGVIPFEGRTADLIIARDVSERKKIQDELTESQELYRALVETSPDAIVMCDLECKLKMANRRALEMYGCENQEELLSEVDSLFELIKPEQQQRAVTELQQLMSIRTLELLEYEVRRRDGSFYPVEVSASVVVDANGSPTAIIGVFRDITERKKAIKEMSESEAKFRTLAEKSPNMVFINNFKHNVYANAQCAQISGYSIDELCSPDFDFLTLIAPESKKIVSESLKRHAQAQEVAPYEYSLITKDGKRIDVINTTKLIEYNNSPAVLGIVTDITAYKQAVEAYRILVENSLQGLVILQNNYIVFANTAVSRMTGYEVEEIKNQPLDFWLQIIHPDDRQRVAERYARRLADKPVSVAYDTRIITKSGDVRWLEIYTSETVYLQHPAIQIAVIDITDRKQTEEEKEKIQSRIRYAEKMEAIGTLAGSLAHDFNNLLTAILSNTDLALTNLEKTDLLEDYLDQVKITTQMAAALTRQLLTFGQKHSLEIRILNLNRKLKAVLKLIRPIMGENISIETKLASDLWNIRADKLQVEQAIMNLVINSRDAMLPTGGRLSIVTKNIVLGKQDCRCIPKSRPGRYVCLSVSDTGTGMTAETVEHVFEPFFSTKKPGEGTGLGLAVVYGIVKQHKGCIEVESKKGEGTTFNLYFPAVRQTASEKSEKSISIEELSGSGERILYIEDEKGVRNATKTALVQNGYTVFDVKNASEAMTVFEKEHGNFDLVFSDIVLPDTNGFDLVDNLRSKQPSLMVLLSSGYSDTKSTKQLKVERGIRHLQKPYALTELLTVLKELLHRVK